MVRRLNQDVQNQNGKFEHEPGRWAAMRIRLHRRSRRAIPVPELGPGDPLLTVKAAVLGSLSASGAQQEPVDELCVRLTRPGEDPAPVRRAIAELVEEGRLVRLGERVARPGRGHGSAEAAAR